MVQKFGRILALLFTNTSRNQTRPKLAFKCPKRLHAFNKKEKKKSEHLKKEQHFILSFILHLYATYTCFIRHTISLDNGGTQKTHSIL